MRTINKIIIGVCLCLSCTTQSTAQVASGMAKQALRVGAKQAIKSEMKVLVKSEAKQVAKTEAKKELILVAKKEAKQAAKTEAKLMAEKEANQMAKSEIKKTVRGNQIKSTKSRLSRRLAEQESKNLAKTTAKQSLQNRTSIRMAQEVVKKDAAIVTERTLQGDLGQKGLFSKWYDNIKTASSRLNIKTKNQYVKAEDYARWESNPANSEQLSKMKYGQPKDPKVLRDNMKLYMGDAYKFAEQGGNAAHHIVGGGKVSASAKKILEKFGIDINDARNGILLPTSPENILKGTNHTNRHLNEYFEMVNRRLGEAQNQSQCLEILDDIKHELYKGKIKLYNQEFHKVNSVLSSFKN